MATKEAAIKPEVRELEKSLDLLQTAAKIVTVKTAEDYARAGQAVTALRDYKKRVKAVLDPFVTLARRHYEEARTEMQKYLNAAEETEARYTGPMTEFKRQERLAAEAEERRINEERQRQARLQAEREEKEARERAEAQRKADEKAIKEAQKEGDVSKREAEKMRKEAAEREEASKKAAAETAEAQAQNVERVTVRPNVPTIAGTRARVNWRFRIVDRSKIPAQFLMPDEQAIGRMVRETKDKAQAEKSCAGIEVFSEDSI